MRASALCLRNVSLVLTTSSSSMSPDSMSPDLVPSDRGLPSAVLHRWAVRAAVWGLLAGLLSGVAALSFG